MVSTILWISRRDNHAARDPLVPRAWVVEHAEDIRHTSCLQVWRTQLVPNRGGGMDTRVVACAGHAVADRGARRYQSMMNIRPPSGASPVYSPRIKRRSSRP